MATMKVFIKINGIPGESEDDKHDGWIEAITYDFNLAQKISRTASSAGGATCERADFSEFSFSKLMDLSTPTLALACAEGRHIDLIKIEIFRPAKIKLVEYILSNCIISAFSTTSEGVFPEDEVAVNFGGIKWIYTQKDRHGGWASGVAGTGWDRMRNCKI